MADNFVTLKIKATDDAKPDLDELKAKLDELGHKVDTAKVDVDDEDGKLKLADMNAKLAELGRKVASPKISLAGAARAQAEIVKIDAAMDHLKEKADKDKGEGQLSKLGAIGGMLFGVGEGADEGNGIIETLKAIATSPVGIAGITVALAAAAVEATGLISGFAAAGAGVGAFAALAMPAFEKVKGAIGDTGKQLAKLSPDERGAVEGIRSLKDEFMKMSNAFQPAAFKVFNDALKIANQLLPALKPFADAAAKALDGLLKQASKFAGSKDFQDWLKQFEKLSGPSITAIGHGIGEVAIAIGKLLTSMGKKDVVNAINLAFDTLKGIIIGLVAAVKGIMVAWDAMHKAADTAADDLKAHMGGVLTWLQTQLGVLTSFWKAHSQQIETISKAVAVAVGVAFKAMAQVAKVAFQLMGQVIHTELELILGIVGVVLDLLTGKWHKAWSGIANTTTQLLGNLRHLIATILDGIASLAYTAGQKIVQGLINGLKSMIGGVGSAIGDIGHVDHVVPAVLPGEAGPAVGAGGSAAGWPAHRQVPGAGPDGWHGRRVGGDDAAGWCGGAGRGRHARVRWHVPRRRDGWRRDDPHRGHRRRGGVQPGDRAHHPPVRPGDRRRQRSASVREKLMALGEVRAGEFAEQVAGRGVIGERSGQFRREVSDGAPVPAGLDEGSPLSALPIPADAFVGRRAACALARVGFVLRRRRRAQVVPLIVEPVAVHVVGLTPAGQELVHFQSRSRADAFDVDRSEDVGTTREPATRRPLLEDIPPVLHDELVVGVVYQRLPSCCDLAVQGYGHHVDLLSQIGRARDGYRRRRAFP